MATKRSRLIAALKEHATLLELDGANSFKVNAFVKGARVLEDESLDLESHIEANSLTKIDGIGKGLAEAILQFWNDGDIEALAELREKYPAGLVEMTRIQGLGAKKAKLIFNELNVDNIDALKAACESGEVAELPGFGKKSAEKILSGIENLRKFSGQFRIDQAREAADKVLARLQDHDDVIRCELAGSARRWKEVVKDVDFVCATDSPESVMDFFTGMDEVDEITGQGGTKASVRLESGISADLRCVTDEQYPYALAHFTGSKEHNVRMRQRAIERGYKLNEYGLHAEDGGDSLAASTEEEIHAHLGLKQFVPPEMREDMGEVEAAEKGELPSPLERDDLRGILHMHTVYSDGEPKVREYAEWAAENGFEWMGITDHSQTAAYAGGLKPEDVLKQFSEIDAVNKEFEPKGVRLLKGIESDILGDGSLDYEDDLLAEFDFIIASVHSRFNLSEDDQTKRMITAIENPFTHVLGHLTGRLLLKRDSYAVRQKDLIRACAENNVVIEINSNPHRLELDWRLIHFALDQGCHLAISPDAHQIAGLDDIRYGVGVARKGWVTKDRMVNCLSSDEFLNFIKK